MQVETIKHQPTVEGIVVTREEERQILKLGRIAGEQLKQCHEDVRWMGNLIGMLAFLLGVESVVIFLIVNGTIML